MKPVRREVVSLERPALQEASNPFPICRQQQICGIKPISSVLFSGASFCSCFAWTQIREEIDKFGIKVYQFPECDSDEDEEFKQQDRELKVRNQFSEGPGSLALG